MAHQLVFNSTAPHAKPLSYRYISTVRGNYTSRPRSHCGTFCSLVSLSCIRGPSSNGFSRGRVDVGDVEAGLGQSEAKGHSAHPNEVLRGSSRTVSKRSPLRRPSNLLRSRQATRCFEGNGFDQRASTGTFRTPPHLDLTFEFLFRRFPVIASQHSINF